MFNLDEFKNEFEVKKVSEFDFYSNIVKQLDTSKEVLSEDPNDFIVNSKDFEFERFTCLTGEEDKRKCQLLIDIKTGYLYSPNWAYNNDVETRFETLGIAGIEGVKEWEKFNTGDKKHISILHPDFKKIKDRSSKNDKRITDNKIILEHIELMFLFNGDHTTGLIFIGDHTTQNSFYHSEYLVYDSDDKGIYYKDGKKSNFQRRNKGLMGVEFDGLFGVDFTPKIFSSIFKDLDIWGEKFSNDKFIKFLKEHNFSPTLRVNSLQVNSVNPKYRSVPDILKDLQNRTGVTLHTDKITFPNELFNSNSLIFKYENFIKYIDFLLYRVEEFSKKSSEKLQQIKTLYNRIETLNSDRENLLKIKREFQKKANFSLEPLLESLERYRGEISEKLSTLEDETLQFFDSEDNSIFDFSPKVQNFDFSLVGETLTRIYNSQIDKISTFSDEVDSLLPLIEKIENLFSVSRTFTVEQKERLKQSCLDEYVENSFEQIWSEWSSEIEKIEKLYTPIIDSTLAKKLSKEQALEFLETLENYRKSIDEFFINSRIPLVHKYDENPKSELLQKVETETAVFKSCSKFRQDVATIIEKESRQTTKKVITSSSDSLQSDQLLNISKFLRSINFSDVIQKKFTELEQKNIETYLSDVKKYNEELKRRDEEIQSLLFKMKKDLDSMDISEVKSTPENIDDIETSKAVEVQSVEKVQDLETKNRPQSIEEMKANLKAGLKNR